MQPDPLSTPRKPQVSARGRMRKAVEQHSRVIDVDGGWNRADKSHQLLAGDHSDPTVPLGQPAWRTQCPGEGTHLSSHLPSKVPGVPAPASHPTLGHPVSCSQQEDERVTAM